MNLVKDEESEESQVLTIGIADNALMGPAICIKHVLDELKKAGHNPVIFSYHERMTEAARELRVFLKELGIEEWEYQTKGDVNADIWFDRKNFSELTDWFSLYGAFFKSALIAHTQRNKQLLLDFNWWKTGKEKSLADQLEQKTIPKIILPGHEN